MHKRFKNLFRNLKSNSGITLLNLVVTVIVLIILALVVLNLLLDDNSIIDLTYRGKESMEITSARQYLLAALDDYKGSYSGTLPDYIRENLENITVNDNIYDKHGIVSGIFKDDYVYIIEEDKDKVTILDREEMDDPYEFDSDDSTITADKDGNITASTNLILFGKSVTGEKGDNISVDFTGYAKSVGSTVSGTSITWAKDLSNIGFTCVYVDDTQKMAYYMADVAIAKMNYLKSNKFETIIYQRYEDTETANTYVDSDLYKFVKKLSDVTSEHLDIFSTQLDSTAVPTPDCPLIETVYENAADRVRTFDGSNIMYWTSSSSNDWLHTSFVIQGNGNPYDPVIYSTYGVVPVALLPLEGQSINHTYVDNTNTHTMQDVMNGYTPKSGDKILISTANDLKNLSSYVSSGKVTEGITFELTASINLNEGCTFNSSGTYTGSPTQWTPIGNSTYKFKGTFNGKKHVISGLYINNTKSYYGLFGYTDANALIKNVTVKDSYFTFGGYSGAIVGYNSGTIKNCKNYAYVSGKGQNVGGIAGVNLGFVKFCFNSGTINSSTLCVGGIIGQSAGSDTSADTTTYCINTGTITGSGYVGGIVGQQTVANIKYCSNLGNITSSGESVGGITGKFMYLSKVGYLYYCSNYGTISGSGRCGGIVGYLDTSGYASIEDTINYGNLGTLGSFRSYMGVKSSYCIDSNTEWGTVATAAEFRNGTVLNNVGGTSIWVQKTNYPVLKWIDALPSGYY